MTTPVEALFSGTLMVAEVAVVLVSVPELLNALVPPP